MIKTRLAAFVGLFLAGSALAASKVVYVVPGGAGDGSSWEDAMGSVSNACASAAAFAESGFDSGEVWIKTGRYTIANQIDIHSHVTVRGGFAGGETDAVQADPKKNLTILSGDKGDDAYWLPDNVDSAVGDRIPIWFGEDKMTYNQPNPDRANNRWVPGHGASGHDNGYCFVGSDALTEDCRFYGITFTGFRYSAVKVGRWVPKTKVEGVDVAAHADESLLGRGIVISNCSFVAHATSGGDAINNGAVQLFNAGAEISDCTFDGCWTALSIRTGETPVTNVIRRCTFSNGSSGQFDYRDASAFNSLIFEDCDVLRNYNENSTYLFNVEQKNDIGRMSISFSRCRIRENLLNGKNPYSIFGSSGNYGYAWRRFYNCDFSGNRALANATNVNVSACVWGGSTSARWYFQGCSFRTNVVENYSRETGSAASVYGSATANNYAYFIDCTLVGNSVKIADGVTATQAGTLVEGTWSDRMYLVGSVFRDNTVSGSASLGKAELAFASPDKNSNVTIANCVLTSEDVDYVPMVLNKAMLAYLHNGYIKNFDATKAGCDAFGRCEGIVTTGDPGLKEQVKGPFVAYAIGMERESSLSKAGSDVRKVEFDSTRGNPSDGRFILIVEHAPGWWLKARQWHVLTDSYSSTLTDEDAAAMGVTVDSPLMTDAFGQPRKAGKVSLGPLAYDAPGLMLLLR